MWVTFSVISFYSTKVYIKTSQNAAARVWTLIFADRFPATDIHFKKVLINCFTEIAIVLFKQTTKEKSVKIRGQRELKIRC